MENVYKTPEAPLVETRGAKRAHFFVTSLGKMSVLFLVTLGLYGVYWMYKHWKAQQPQMERRISPVWRAIFGIFFFHALARRIHPGPAGRAPGTMEPEQGCDLGGAADGRGEPDQPPHRRGPRAGALLAALAPAAAHAAYPDAQHPAPGQLASGDPQGTGNAGYSGYNLLFIVLGALYWLLILIGSAVILFGSSQG
ncbi:hypothetical protein P4123_30975 [Pseudomonas aeruginosa]|nr:hypothetical protein [Pseudomonas aeruginosa]